MEKASNKGSRDSNPTPVEADRNSNELKAWLKREVQLGIDAADRGEFATDEEMADLFGRFGA